MRERDRETERHRDRERRRQTEIARQTLIQMYAHIYRQRDQKERRCVYLWGGLEEQEP